MGAIGGIFKTEGEKNVADGTVLINRAMSFRARGSSFAHIGEDFSLISRSSKAKTDADTLIGVHESENAVSALVLDGAVRLDGKEINADDLLCECASIETLSPSLSGDFALALYDGNKNEMTLVRNVDGSRPLFCVTADGITAFSSEIKALLKIDNCPHSVRQDKFCEYILSGIPQKALPFEDIFELPPSGGYHVSKAGIFPFYYDGAETDPVFDGVIDPEIIFPLADELHPLLLDILCAFDYPSFDVFMPSFIYCLDSLKSLDTKNLALLDPTLTYNIRYSKERRDRLCSIKGLYVDCIPPRTSPANERELRRAECIMLEILSNTDKHILTSVLGKDYEIRLKNEKSTARRIRTEGMLCQLPLWCEKYNPVFV